MEATEVKSSSYSKILDKISVPAISISIAFVLGVIVLLIMGQDPFLAFKSMFIDIFFNQKGEIELNTLANVFFYSTPLILTGLSVAIAFRAGMFNIGAEGQVIIGGFLTALVGSALAGAGYNLPFFIMIPLLIICGLLGGSLWALVPALLKTRGVHEVITTIMMNYIAYTLIVFLIGDLDSPFSDKTLAGNISPQTPPIASSGRIQTILGRDFSALHWGFLLNICVCVIIYFILWRTQLGYETRAVGLNASAAKYGGISVNRNLVKVMLISGALAGLVGSLVVMGPLYGFFLYGSTAGLGFDGIAVAIIGGNHPFGVLFGAILFGWLQASTTKLQQNQIPKDIANTMKGFIVLIVAVPLFSKIIIDTVKKSIDNPRELIPDFIFRIRKNVVFDIVMNFLFIPSILIYMIISGELIPDIALIFGNTLILDLPIRTLVSILLAAFFLFGYYLMRKNSHQQFWSFTTQKMFLIYSLPFVVFTFLNLVKLFKQDIILLSLAIIIIIFIIYQEFRARDTGVLLKAIKEDELLIGDGYNKNKIILLYSIAIVLASAFAFLIVYTESRELPAPIWLFFVTLENFGAAIGLISVVIIVALYFILRRVPKPRDQSSIYYLPFLFIFITVFFGFISISSIFDMNPFLLFTQTLSIAAPIGFASLGGMFSEKSGVVNIGLEGMMLSGAFVAVWVADVTNNPWMGVFGAVIAGLVMGLLHAVASITFRADQVVVGVAINILASALSMLGLVFVWNVRGTSPLVNGLPNIKLLFLKDIPVIGEFFYNLSGGSAGLSPLVYIFIFFIFLSFWIIERTAFGLRVRAVGEHPRAADTLGINVFNMRYICVALSGILAALGGAQLTLGWSPIFGRDMTTGRGFVALAALIFGGWSPVGAGLASLLFGFAIAFRRQLEALGTKWAIMILGFIWRFEKLTPMLPYLLTIIAVSTVAKRMRPPAADGIPYVKEGG
ncbi:MAG: hypothetical protein ACFFAE_00315 [Candidatus Hodarchaeota archaeon]